MVTTTKCAGSSTDDLTGAAMFFGTAAALWGVGGILLMLGSALYRLMPVASDSLQAELGAAHWAVLAASVGLMAYAEGYRGFQTSLAPRVAARARDLQQQPRWGRSLVAPAYCIGLVAAPRREVIARIALIAMIAAFVIGVRQLDAPWRGLIDVGVIVGLSWGALSIALQSARAISRPAG